MTAAQQVIDRAGQDVGFVEGPNNDNPFGRWFGIPNAPYCAMAVSLWSYESGLPVPASTAKGYAYTPSGAAWFQREGRWGSDPRRGAHVFFRFSGQRIHHVGLVTGVDGGTIETIEANTSRGTGGSQRDGGGVWRRRRSSGIVGYGYPAYDEAQAPPPPQGGGGPAYPGRLLRRGVTGGDVRTWQARMAERGWRIAADGAYGPGSEDVCRRFQQEKRLGADGVVGPRTWAATWDAPIS